MKKYLLTVALTVAAVSAGAQPEVELNETNFPDNTFREKVAVFDKDNDGRLSEAELKTCRVLKVSNSSITSVKGVELLTSLINIECDKNALGGELDLSKNLDLQSVYCSSCKLTSLVLPQTTTLKIVSCHTNSLTALDVSGCTELTQLMCSDNQYATLDVTHNTLLTRLSFGSPNLTAIDLSKNTQLINVSVSASAITSIDFSNQTGITSLEIIGSKQLTTLDVSMLPKLYQLVAKDCGLTELRLPESETLKSVLCQNNQLTALDVSMLPILQTIFCFGNKLTTLDFKKNPALITVYCYNNLIKGTGMAKLIKSLPVVEEGKEGKIQLRSKEDVAGDGNDFTGEQALMANAKGWKVYYNRYMSQWLEYEYNESVAIDEANFPDAIFRAYVAENFDTDKNGSLNDMEYVYARQVFVSNKGIATLKGIEFLPYMTLLRCDGNELTELDLSGNSRLGELYCMSNKLTTLDLAGHSSIYTLECQSNNLTTLDLTDLVNLITLYCGNAGMTSLTLPEAPRLTKFYCQQSDLTSLDVSKQTALETLAVDRNKLTTLNVAGLNSLTSIRCFGNQMSGEGMDAFVNSLPTVTEGKLQVIYGNGETNTMTAEQATVAHEKGWTPLYYDSATRQWEDYYQKTPVKTLVAAPEADNAACYTLDGRRVSGKPVRKGVYVVGTSKVVVR